jgi:hypothetical protein
LEFNVQNLPKILKKSRKCQKVTLFGAGINPSKKPKFVQKKPHFPSSDKKNQDLVEKTQGVATLLPTLFHSDATAVDFFTRPSRPLHSWALANRGK